MSTLVINKSDSYHRECGPWKGNSAPEHESCPNCGVKYTIVSSDYAGTWIETWIKRRRPDLEPYFPYSGFFDSTEGKDLLDELTTDTNQED